MTRVVLFDLDGTLTDAFDGIARSIQHALAELHCPIPERASLRRCVGPPIRDSFVELLGANGRVDEALAIYRERYGSVGLFENRVYPGVTEMLVMLLADGARLFVCTSKRTRFAKRILEHFALDRFFADVYGSEDHGRFDDKRDLIRHILESTKLDPASTMMVGDREHDVRAALANDVRPIGVTWGYGSREELIDAGARDIFDSPSEVTEALVGT